MRSARDSSRPRRRLPAWTAAIIVSSCLLPPFASSAGAKQPKAETSKTAPSEGYAVWYSVPPKSLAKRRAPTDELTAAHNSLPLGTRVRVTHLKNGKNVIVRITDRGISSRRAVIDLCKEAAAKLDMLHEGSVRVRLEVLPDDKKPASKTSAASW
jgi:rare lipoprotein A